MSEHRSTITGRTAVVTGGSKGIGRAVALELASLGMAVCITFRRDRASADAVVEAIRSSNVEAFAVRANVSRYLDVVNVLSEVARRWARLDVFVSNAIDAVSFGPISKARADAWHHTVLSHTMPLVVAGARARELMSTEDGGCIIAVSSLGARLCLPGYSAVGVGKAAAESLVRYLAIELADRHVRVNAVAAGAVRTEALKRSVTPRDLEDATELHPSRRLGNPRDVANAVALLCSDRAKWISGHVLVADGGESLVGIFRDRAGDRLPNERTAR